MYFGVATSQKIFFSCISTSSLSCVQRLFSKMKLVKPSLRTHLKQTNLENRFHISIESPKEVFNDTVFQNFMNELKDCNSDAVFPLISTPDTYYILKLLGAIIIREQRYFKVFFKN